MTPNSKKEVQKRILVKQTLNSINKQIQKLEEQKQVYINAGREAQKQGLTAQYNLALTGLKMTLVQQKRICEMKLNFEITSQMRDMSVMTTEFLNGMGVLSQGMLKLTKEKDFLKVKNQFSEAMVNMEVQVEQLEGFMDDTQSAMSLGNNETEAGSAEEFMQVKSEVSSDINEMIDKELEMLKKKMSQ